MRKHFRIFTMPMAAVLALAISAPAALAQEKKDAAAPAAAPAAAAPAAPTKPKDRKDMTGKELAFDRALGNCLACHMIEGGDLPGNIGPPLVGMKARYPDKEKLRAQIYDPRTSNPDTIMMPFGPMGILTDQEIDKIADFIHSL